MLGRWCKELLAIGMVGEGVAGLLAPRRYLLLWRLGPEPFQKWLEGLAAHRRVMRLVFVAEAGLGIWLTLQQTGHVGDDSQTAGSSLND
jgi:hypothetical protein